MKNAEKHRARNDRIRALRAQGMGPTPIAAEMGLSLAIVAGVFHRADRPKRAAGRQDRLLTALQKHHKTFPSLTQSSAGTRDGNKPPRP